MRHFPINLDRAEFSRQAAHVLAETEAMLGRLAQAMGTDYWQLVPDRLLPNR